MPEPTWDDEPDRKPLTPADVDTWTGSLANMLRELKFLAESYRDAANRCATLESENHDLRILLGLRDVEHVRRQLGELNRAALLIRSAVNELDAQVPNVPELNSGQGV